MLSVLAITVVTHSLNSFRPCPRVSHSPGTNELQQPYEAERLGRGENRSSGMYSWGGGSYPHSTKD